MINNIIGRISLVRDRFRNVYRKAITTSGKYVTKKPFASLFVALGILVGLIVLSNALTRPRVEESVLEKPIKKVSTFHIGQAPTLRTQAQVEKSGVITITALSPGVVQTISVNPGDVVAKGKVLISTSTNYQGGNIASLQSALSSRTLQNVQETYDTQKDIIAKQKEIAEKTDANADELRSITNESLSETQSLIDLNNSILDTLSAKLKAYEAVSDSDNILLTKQSISSYTASNNALKSSLRNARYSGDAEKPQAVVSDRSKEISLAQLTLQEKAVELNRDVSRLQYRIARVQEAAMYPSAPFKATVQRVLVKVGQAVSPGTPLIVLSQVIEDDPIVALAFVPRETARMVSFTQPSKLFIKDSVFETYPSYVTQDAIQGSLYGVYYPIPDNYSQFVTEKGYISVEIPVGHSDTSAAAPFIPIDSVFQTQDSAFVFTIEKGVAKSRTITLGDVAGKYVEVKEGLQSGDTIILDRTVVSGEKVTAIK